MCADLRSQFPQPEQPHNRRHDPPQDCPMCGAALVYASRTLLPAVQEAWRSKITVGCEHCARGLSLIVTQDGAAPSFMLSESYRAARLLHHRALLGYRYCEQARGGWQNGRDDEAAAEAAAEAAPEPAPAIERSALTHWLDRLDAHRGMNDGNGEKLV